MEQAVADGNITRQSSNEILSFEFRGQGMEYFKIWIVNILFTIITLGIYSAWATVRNNRYFYSNTFLANDNFRYLADPITILKGRLIAVALLIIYNIVIAVSPGLAIVFAVTLMIAIPYFYNRSMAFKCRVSSFRNIQFRFSGTYGQAFMVLYLWPLLGLLSLGLLYPVALKKHHEYVVSNSSYGTSPFEYGAKLGDYYLIFLTIIGIGLVMGVPAVILSAVFPDIAALAVVFYVVMYFGIIAYSIVAVTNLFINAVTLQEHKMAAKLEMVGLAKVMLINAFLIAITLGLYLPAAKVRMTRYVASKVEVLASGSLDDFVAAEQDNTGALGDEMGQVFDFA